MNDQIKPQNINKVYPKIIVFCPKDKKEKSGDECLGCDFFEGIEVDKEEGLFYFECRN